MQRILHSTRGFASWCCVLQASLQAAAALSQEAEQSVLAGALRKGTKTPRAITATEQARARFMGAGAEHSRRGASRSWAGVAHVGTSGGTRPFGLNPRTLAKYGYSPSSTFGPGVACPMSAVPATSLFDRCGHANA